MKTIGLIGGMSWESTLLYYRHINQEVARRRGGLHSAPLLLRSLDFEEVVRGQQAGAWDDLAHLLASAACDLECAGADGLLICTNTMHRIYAEVARAVQVPVLHIADATLAALHQTRCSVVALLGTRYTMEQGFYADHLARAGVRCLVPDEPERAVVHRIIFDELCQGRICPESRGRLMQIIDGLRKRGAEGVVLGCTELSLLLSNDDTPLAVFDTTRLHALAAVDFALGAAQRQVPAAKA